MYLHTNLSRSARQGGRLFQFLILLGAFALGGCLSVKAPDSIVIGEKRSSSTDSGHAPPNTSVEQCRSELDKAYRKIQQLEDRNQELSQDNAKLKRERDEYKRQVED